MSQGRRLWGCLVFCIGGRLLVWRFAFMSTVTQPLGCTGHAAFIAHAFSSVPTRPPKTLRRMLELLRTLNCLSTWRAKS